jgi:hypothetical protein
MTVDAVRCPFCDSSDIETVSAWGGQLITRQVRCPSCNTHFEAVRDDFEAAPASGEPQTRR